MVLVTAALLGALLVLSPTRWREWLYLSLVLLVTSCPCALVISTPVASAAGLARAAGAGVLVKGGRFLELLGQVGWLCVFGGVGCWEHGSMGAWADGTWRVRACWSREDTVWSCYGQLGLGVLVQAG